MHLTTDVRRARDAEKGECHESKDLTCSCIAYGQLVVRLIMSRTSFPERR